MVKYCKNIVYSTENNKINIFTHVYNESNILFYVLSKWVLNKEDINTVKVLYVPKPLFYTLLLLNSYTNIFTTANIKL